MSSNGPAYQTPVDDDGNVLPCNRRPDGHRCGEPLNDDGTCSYCETEACEACGRVVEPGTLTPVTDQGVTLRCCPGECGGRAPAPMGTVEAMGLAVRAVLGESNLLNGADEECDVCEDTLRGHEPTGLYTREDAVRIGGGALDDEDPEEETREIAVETMSELVHGKREGRAA